MTPDDIIAVLSVGMCHGADKAAECPTCTRKRAAISEVRTGREQLLAALAGIAERDAEIERLRATVRNVCNAATTVRIGWAEMQRGEGRALGRLMDELGDEVRDAWRAVTREVSDAG